MRVAHRTLVIASLLGSALAAQQPNPADTRLLQQPAIAGDRIAFIYAGDLWSAKVDGSELRRLTTADGEETNPVFSPDGSLIAFSANYDGNVDVYVVPTTGGVPRRLTWHPDDDLVQAFSRDGKSVLFASGRASYVANGIGQYAQLWIVPVDGGIEERLPIPNATRATYSPDGSKIAYNPLARAFNEWKRYRGGLASWIWLYDRSSHAVEKIPQPATRSNDVDPMWIGDVVYFRSDRDGDFDLYAYDTKSKQVKRVTTHADFPVMNASADARGNKIIYEQAGWLHVLDPSSGASRRLTIGVPADLRELRPRFAKGAQWIRNATLSPSGARAAFEFRGEIVTVPAEKGDVRDVTNTTGANERSPAWSPDGGRLAYVSDASGEYEIVVAPQDGRGEAKRYKPSGHGFYSDLAWSPDGRRIAYTDNSQSVYVLELAGGTSKRVGGNVSYVPAFVFDNTHDWSPDSKWLAYTVNTHPLVETLFLYSVDQDKSFKVTDDLAEVARPAFDRNGKYLYLFASTNAGPVQDWFAQSNADFRRTRSIYAVVLGKSTPNPLAKQSDEERPADPKAAPGADTAARAKAMSRTNVPAPAAAPAPAEPSASGPIAVDLAGIESRIVALPIPDAELSALDAGEPGTVYYLRTVDGTPSLHRFSMATRKDETLIPGATQFHFSADGKKLLYRTDPASWFIAATSTPIVAGQGKLATNDIEVRVDPRAEWKQIFEEGWRINRDYFYDPKMHGVDWAGMKRKYEALLPDVGTRADLNRVIQWMHSELSIGHHGSGGGDQLVTPARVSGGLLGADYAVANGRYRFATVYGGLNWTPDLRAPLTEPGVGVKAGEYLLAVNGRDLRPPTNVHAPFENTAGKIVEITVGPNADGSGSRTVQVVPIADESALRSRAWVEGNIRKVDSATAGRVAYVYVPNTAGEGHDYFKRYFYPQAHKQGIIVDERFNGGGLLADYYIDILRRPQQAYWATRWGEDLRTPAASIQGPKALIVNETAGSGGDFFPWMFHKYQIGPIIGKRTWGGLVGTLGFPVLMDGGYITAPNVGIWTPEEGWVVENVGVPPDIEVEQTPAEVIAGHDPQLEKAIEVVMGELKKAPPSVAKRPAYPDKSLKR